MIDDTQGHGDGTGRMRFRLWPAQVAVVFRMMAEQLLVILKARQLGISWIACGFSLWFAWLQPGKLVLLISRGEREAIEMLRRVKVLYRRLPPWMRERGPQLVVDNQTEFGWDNESKITSLPSGEGGSGRGNAASLVVLDEAAYLKFEDALWTGLTPTIDGGGRLIVLSTANGVGNLFHTIWTGAVNLANGFGTIFLPWWTRPERDQAWFERAKAKLTDPRKAKQEYPANAVEAFLASGRTRFDADWINAQAGNIRDALPTASLPDALRSIPGLSAYQLPKDPRANLRKQSLILAADVAEGLEHGDYSTAVLLDAETWEEVASLHGHWEPDEFAEHLFALSNAYQAPIAVERNNHGHAVLSRLKSLKCARVLMGKDGRRGWLTNVQTKPQAIDALAAALRDGVVTIRTSAALAEMQIYRILDDGGTGSPPNKNDDRVMAWAIALGCLKLGLHRAETKRYF